MHKHKFATKKQQPRGLGAVRGKEYAAHNIHLQTGISSCVCSSSKQLLKTKMPRLYVEALL